MESDNIAKFKEIVAGLSPEKKKEIRARMQGMSKDEAMVFINRMVDISEQRKIEITARPKVLAGSGRVENGSHTDYEVRETRTWSPAKEAPKRLSDDKIEIVKNPNKPRTTSPSASRPNQRVTCSSAHFDPVTKVTWRPRFHVKLMDDITVDLI